MNINLITLFFSSFLAATILPFSSEAHLALSFNGSNTWIVIIVATVGNSLGSVVNYFLGYYSKIEWARKYLKIKQEHIDKFSKVVTKYGNALALLVFMPIIGDPISFVLGLNKNNPVICIFLMSLGKFLRYALIGYLHLRLMKTH